jgi:hypothetical protein
MSNHHEYILFYKCEPSTDTPTVYDRGPSTMAASAEEAAAEFNKRYHIDSNCLFVKVVGSIESKVVGDE